MSGPVEELTNNVKQTVKNISKKMVKHVLMFLIPFLIVIFICAAAYQSLSDAFSKLVSEYTEANPAKYSSGSTDYSINIDEETVDKLIESVEGIGINISSLNLSKDDIKKFYIAEVVSQEINRGGSEVAGKYYGRVYIKRASSENNSTADARDMKFLPYGTFMQKASANESDIKDYFSINGNKLVIAGTKTERNEEGVETTTVNVCEKEYKTSIAKYAMPLEFLLDLAFVTKSPNFVSELADKVINDTRIEITVMDDTTTIESNIVYKYKNAVSKKAEARIYKSDPETSIFYDTNKRVTEKNQEENQIEETFTTENKTTKTVTSEPNIQVTSVKTWITNGTIQYNNDKAEPVKGDTNVEKIEDEKPVHTEDSYVFGNSEDIDDDDPEDNSMTELRYYISECKYKVEQQKETTETITDSKYVQGTTEQSDDKIDEFVELLNKTYEIEGSNIKEAPIGKLKNGSGILFEMLKKSAKTQELEQLMRYVLNEYTGTNQFGDITKDDIKNSFNIGKVLVGSDYIVDITKLKSNQVITDSKTLKSVIEKISSGDRKDNLTKEADNFIGMQKEYNVSAVFAVAVTIVESGGGTDWAAIDPSTYNWYSIKGDYNGNSKNGWCAYSSFKEATYDFGDWIANSRHYFKNGKYTVKEIAPTYCNEKWGDDVVAVMASIYEAAGIKIPESNDKKTNTEKLEMFYNGNDETSSKVEKEMQQLQEEIETELINTKPHYKDSAYQNGPFEKWWSNNGLEAFQCTWWAYGRALMYLEKTGSLDKESDLFYISGNGGQYYTRNENDKRFNYSANKAKAHSLACWSKKEYDRNGNTIEVRPHCIC